MSSIGQILSTISVRVNEIKKKYSDSIQAVLALDEVLSYLRQYDNTESISNNENFSMAISVSDSTFSLMDLGEDSPRELSDINNEAIAAIRKKSQALELDYSKYNIDKITKLQNVISRFLLRKRFNDIVRGAYNNSELKPFAKRNEIWREILSTETSYVDSLLLLEKYYAYPLREKIGTPEEIIDKKDYNSIFSNIQLILKFNSGFLSELQNLTKEWPSKTSIGAVFVDHLPYIKLYTQYVNNFSNSIYVRQNHKSNKKFQAFNLGNQHILKGITLSNLLIIPIQRVPRYKMLLECLLKVTPKNHIDYNKLKDSFEMISEITNDLDECKLKAENLEKISNIFDQISDLPPTLEIYKGGRKFIREGPIKRKNKKSKRYLYLFNDILVITFMSNPNNDSIKTYEEYVNLEFASISDVPNSISFMICESKRKIKFCPVTNGEKMSWILDISGAIENIKRPAIKNTPVIGNLTRLRSATLIPSGPSSPRAIHREEIQIRDAEHI